MGGGETVQRLEMESLERCRLTFSWQLKRYPLSEHTHTNTHTHSHTHTHTHTQTHNFISFIISCEYEGQSKTPTLSTFQHFILFWRGARKHTHIHTLPILPFHMNLCDEEDGDEDETIRRSVVNVA